MTDEPDIDDSERAEDDPVLVAGALLIQTGSVERTERQMRSKHGLTRQEAADTVEEAMFKVIASAPNELRPSFESVCSYHRWNHMYQTGERNGNMKEAMEAQKAIDSLLRGVH